MSVTAGVLNLSPLSYQVFLIHKAGMQLLLFCHPVLQAMDSMGVVTLYSLEEVGGSLEDGERFCVFRLLVVQVVSPPPRESLEK